MSAQEEFQKALKYVGIDVQAHCIGVIANEEHMLLWIPDTYVFREPEKTVPSPQPDEPKIDIDEMRRIGSAPAMASGDAKGPDGSFNTGMSLRMWLAGRFMSACLVHDGYRGVQSRMPTDRAREAFTYADDMILESLR